MEQMLIRVLNMSLTAGVTILAVMLIRMALRRAPKIFSYVLWIPVLIRLLCPVSFSLDFSLPGLVNAPAAERGQIWYIPENIGFMGQPQVSLPGQTVTDMVNSSLPTATPMASMNPMQGILFVGAVLWLAGAAVMVLCSLLSCGRLLRKLRGAVREEGGRIYLTDQAATPFVCGLLRPRIYLPDGLSEEEKACVLLHEQIHIRRGDPIWRALGYIALCIHWFNPLVWAAFFLSERDMEMSCDEAAIGKLGSSAKKGYCAALLSVACGRRIAPGFPPAFGEGQTGGRIRNLFHYKETGKRGMAALAVICLAVTVFLVANPSEKGGKEEHDGYSCYRIPIGENALSWGMSREELTAVLGEPTKEEKSDAGETLTWDAIIEGEFGRCSQVIMYVGDHNLTDPGDISGEKLSGGLCGILMTLEDTTREKALEKIEGFYGELSPEGGATLMESQLKEGVPDYFNEMHFCEEWRLGNLPEEDYDRLVESYRANRPDRLIGEEDLLMSVYLWGVALGDTYPCVVQLDVSMMGKLAYLPGER